VPKPVEGRAVQCKHVERALQDRDQRGEASSRYDHLEAEMTGGLLHADHAAVAASIGTVIDKAVSRSCGAGGVISGTDSADPSCTTASRLPR
jgi:hypothetical protein